MPEAARRLPPFVFAVAAIVVILLVNAWMDATGRGRFFTLAIQDGRLFGMPVDVLKHAARLAITAIGMTLVIAGGGVDLSVGAVAAVSGAVAATVVAGGGSFSEAAGVALLAALGLGAWNGFLVAVLRMQPIVATLVLMVAGRGVAQLVTDGQIVTFHSAPFVYLSTGAPLGLPVAIYLAAAFALLVGLGVRATGQGLLLEAVGRNRRAARLAGIRERRIVFSTYLLSALAAGLTGLLIAAEIKGADSNHAGLYLELDAVFAAVVGGTVLGGGRFSLTGAIVGAILLQLMTTTLYALDVNADVAPLPKAVVIILTALAASPSARARLFRRRAS